MHVMMNDYVYKCTRQIEVLREKIESRQREIRDLEMRLDRLLKVTPPSPTLFRLPLSDDEIDGSDDVALQISLLFDRVRTDGQW